MAQAESFHRKNIRLPRDSYKGHQWYFLTACTEGRSPRLLEAKLVHQQLMLVAACAQKDFFNIVAYCFMPDHLHLLVSATSDKSDCLAFVSAFKQRSAFEFKRSSGARLWQHKFYDHILRPQARWEPVAYYIWMNPVRKLLCARPEEWPFSGSQSVDWKRLLRSPGPQWTPPWKRIGLT